MTNTTASGSNAPTVIDGRAPGRDTDATRVVVAPGALAVGDGAGRRPHLVVRFVGPDGPSERLFRGTGLLRAAEAAAAAVRERRPDAVWLAGRSAIGDGWPRWTVAAGEDRLATAAAEAGAALVVWTGVPRGPVATGADGT